MVDHRRDGGHRPSVASRAAVRRRIVARLAIIVTGVVTAVISTIVLRQIGIG
jgi:hypothetical protein